LLLGVSSGYLVTRSRFLTQLLEPVISGLFSIPITLLFPLFILLFGIGPASKVAYGAAYGFFPIALNTIAGFSGVDERYRNAARSMGIFRLRHLPPRAPSGGVPCDPHGLRIGSSSASPRCLAARRFPRSRASAATSRSRRN